MKKLLILSLCVFIVSCNSSKQDTFTDDTKGDLSIVTTSDLLSDFPEYEPEELPEKCKDAHLWDYPVKPGSKEWEQFQTHEEMVNACQIPEDLFSCLTTDELTDLVLRYPLIADPFALNRLGEGLDLLFISFNGVRELFKRSAVANSLVKKYNTLIQSCNEIYGGEHSALEKGYHSISIYTLEVLISRIELQGEQKEKIYKEVLKALVAGYEERLKYPDEMGPSFVEYNFFARAYIISKICNECIDIEHVIGGYTMIFIGDKEVYDLIIELSDQLTK